MYSLKEFNTFGIDAHCDNLICIKSSRDIPFGINSEYFVLGGGSNILFTRDISGLILKNEIKGKQVIQETSDEVIVKFGSGEIWHDVVLWAIGQEYGGIENLSLIPGTIGAAPIQNIGAYGVELKDVFYSLEGYFMDTGDYVLMTKEECCFGYRDSVFKNSFKNSFKNKIFITSVSLIFSKINHCLNIGYGAIQSVLESRKSEDINIRTVSNAVISIRQSKLPDPSVLFNCGSFFKNPIVSLESALLIKKDYEDLNYYSVSDIKAKIPAAWLIDKCNWKGKRKADVGVYKNHALVIVNYGNATGQEVWEFASEIIASVENKFGIRLSPEVTVM